MNSAVYRDQLHSDLTRHNVEVKVQEDFKDLGGETLYELDVYISDCDAVVHLIGDMTGDSPGELGLSALRQKYPDLTDKLPPLGEALRRAAAFHTLTGRRGSQFIMARSCLSRKLRRLRARTQILADPWLARSTSPAFSAPQGD